MTISREKKAEILDVLKDRFGRHQGVVFLGYRGTSVKDLTSLRDALRAEGLDCQVAKKRLVMKAAKEASNVEIDETIFGKVPFTLVLGYHDQVAPCRISAKFAKQMQTLQVLGGIIDGKVLDKAGILEYASLPSREELLAKFINWQKQI